MLQNDLDWALMPFEPPMPLNDLVECMNDLNAVMTIDEGKLDDLVAAIKSKYQQAKSGDQGEFLRGAAKKAGEKVKGAARKVGKVGRKAKRFVTGESGAEKKLEEVKNWLDRLQSHYKKAELNNIMGHILEFGKQEPKEVLDRLRKWAKHAMIPSLRKRLGYANREAEMAQLFHKKLVHILGID